MAWQHKVAGVARWILAALAVLAVLPPPAAGGVNPALDRWLRDARLGPYAEPRFDEAALYQQARQEGSVTVYSYSSRIAVVARSFEQRYPGIKVNWFDIDGAEILTKVVAEQRAGNYLADVIFLIGMPELAHMLAPRGMAVNYVPPDLVTKIPRRYREPFLSHQLNFRVLYYNTERGAAPPVDNLWDLTQPEWRGRVLFPDPLKLPEFLAYLVMVTVRHEDMARAHLVKYGPLTLGPGVENAGYEWIRRLLENRVVVVPSADAVVEAVGRPGQARAPVGISAWSLMRLKERNPALQVDVARSVEPVAAVSDRAVIAIPAFAPHPAAAKLFIRWLMGDEKGGGGFAPYHIVGHLPARADVPPPRGMPLPHQLRFWDPDHGAIWARSAKVREFWLRHLR
ncbi:MAG: extracellular solute-binding protein [Armatimonadota bacterium]|nr:extracellular solute-binding protein [Armatimonadota bacterium]